MLLIPAIDIREGQCVRLYQGKMEEVTVYSEDPVEIALFWEKAGAPMLHVVDLDAAFSGTPQNLDVIERMMNTLSIPIQVGGGIRSTDTIKKIFDIGAKRVILGTIAINNPDLVMKAVEQYGEGIIVGIDSKDGFVAVEGWEATTHKTSLELAEEMEGLGVSRIIYTDTKRDGTLEGPNIDATKEIAEKTTLKIIASGGMSSLEDIKKVMSLEKIGVEGVIIGKALYAEKISYSEALKVVGGDN